MPMKIDQTGLPPGEPGYARNDGLSTGNEVTLTDTTPGGSSVFEILWVDPADSSALQTLEPDEHDDHVWRFTPMQGVVGPIRIRLTHTLAGVKTVETRIFGIPDLNGVVPPCPGERSDPNSNRGNETNPVVISRCERNWRTEEFPGGNPHGWGPDIAKALRVPLPTRRFVDVDVATERRLEAYGQVGGEAEEDPATFIAEDPGQLVVDGEPLEVGQFVLLLWETSAKGVCRVTVAGDEDTPWEMIEVFEDKFANSENMYRVRAGAEHSGRLFAKNRYGEYSEVTPILNPIIVEEPTTYGPGTLLVAPSGVPIELTMRNIGAVPTRFHQWRLGLKVTDGAELTINVPDGQLIESDDGDFDNFYNQVLPTGAYREWVFSALLGQWLMVGRSQQSLGG